MSDVDWGLEKCNPNTIARLGIYDHEKVASLKLDQNLSGIIFNVPPVSCSGIDSLAGLLKANPNIKTLRVSSTPNSNNGQAREYLLRVLADGIAGDSLEYFG